MTTHRLTTHIRQLPAWLLVISGLVVSSCASNATHPVATQTVTASDPARQRQDPKEIARVRTDIAAEYIRNHQLDDAERQLAQALAANPKSAQAYDMMGVLLMQEGSPINLQKADGYFKKALSLDPNFTQAHHNYGVYLAQMQRYAEAISQFQIAGSTLGYEGRASALENLGRTALKVNNKPMATQAFMKALDADRQSIIARSELIDILLADGQLSGANALYQDLVKLIGENRLDPRTLMQGIRIAKASHSTGIQQTLTQQLFDRYPLSDEAKQLKTWLSNPAAPWK